MADDINKVMLVGRLTRDAELQYTNTGTALCKFSLAVNRRKKQGEQWIDEVNYFDIQLWGRRGESLQQYLLKGGQIAVEGQLRQERWEQDGMKRSKVSITALNVQLLGSRGDGGSQTGHNAHGSFNGQQGGEYHASGNRSQPNPTYGGQQKYTPPSEPLDDDDSDIPF